MSEDDDEAPVTAPAPCPFCKKNQILCVSQDRVSIMAECWDCGARGPTVTYSGWENLVDDRIAAIEAWNKRA